MFFQNPFGEEFRGRWPIGQDVTFFIGANVNGIGQPILSWNTDTFDFSVNNILHINFAFDPARKLYSTISINVAGINPAVTYASEVVSALNADSTFSSYFNAFVQQATRGATEAGPSYRVGFRPINSKQNIRYYVSNEGAEIELKFNAKAPVKELPSYFVRHTVANRFNYPDSQACLIELNPLNSVDAAIITAAGLDPLNPLTDWEILHGRSNTHLFKKITLDGNLRITEIIEYPAGAVVGDMAKKYQYTYIGTNTTPNQITEIPYTLQSGDLVIPP